MSDVIKAGDDLIPLVRVQRIDISGIEDGRVIIHTDDGDFEALGFDALECVMLLKPSALEGRRFKWKSGAWAWHNTAGHTGTQLLAWMGFKKAAVRWHDYTTPHPRDFKAKRQAETNA